MQLRLSFKRREKFLVLLLIINLYLSIVEQRETLKEVYLVALERSSLSKVLIYIYVCVAKTVSKCNRECLNTFSIRAGDTTAQGR